MAPRRILPLVVLLSVLLGVPGAQTPSAAQAPSLPEALSNEAFWTLSQSLSEPGGFFRSDNLVSNEVYYQTIIPDLIGTVRPGGVYLGVGPEQNFTYIAALKPRMVFIVDVRRGNLHMHLMYKALFELSKDRAEFVSRLFSKARPAGLTTASTARELFSSLIDVETTEATYQANLKAILDHLTVTRKLPLDDADRKGIEYVYYHFYWFGPGLTYASSSSGIGRGNFVNYQTLMIADDGAGRMRSYLATEDLFRVVKTLHERNLFVPVVGNFAGAKAVRGVGTWLRERGAVVSAFYLSNVEQYLSQEGLWMTFCGNVARLPLDDTSTFIYSEGGGGGRGRGSLLSWYRPMMVDVKANKCEAAGSGSFVR